MNCPQCGQPADSGAVFCGNCGAALQPVSAAPPLASGYPQSVVGVSSTAFSPLSSPSAQVPPAAGPVVVPAYAIGQAHHTDTKLVAALVCGIVGIAAGIFIAVLGLILGIAGLILATTAKQSAKKLKIIAIILSCLAIITGLAVWALVVAQQSKQPNGTATSTTTTHGVASTDTPCYSFSFVSSFTVDTISATCSLNAYNANSLATSNEIYKVLSSRAAQLTSSNFNAISKDALEKDIHTSLPGFTITSQGPGYFAGSPAYSVNATDPATNVAIQETTVLHSTAQGDNLFVLIHATSGKKTDLGELEADWQWK